MAKVLKRRGEHPGLVHVISAMEACGAYQPWHDKQSTRPSAAGQRQVPPLLFLFHRCRAWPGLSAGADLGTVPPAILLQRSQLAGAQLTAEGIGFTVADNAFIRIDDWQRSGSGRRVLARPAAPGARPLCRAVLPGARRLPAVLPLEPDAGRVRNRPGVPLRRDAQAALPTTRPRVGASVKAEQIASFLGRQISPQLAQEIGSQFSTRIEGTCIKHRFASSSIKMYDKYGCVLRIETTTNDVSFFKHHRKVEHRQGPPTRVLAPVKKTIYSLIDLREIMLGCNRRYLAHLAALDDFSAGVRALNRLTKPRSRRAEDPQGNQLLRPGRSCLAARATKPAGQHRRHPPRRPEALRGTPHRLWLSRQLRRLRDLGVIKRVAGTYRYYLTRIGRAAIAAACSVTQFRIIPALALAR